MKNIRKGVHSRGTARSRSPLLLGSAFASAMLVAGCTAPTYGTGTPADEQLLQDLSSAMTLTPNKKPQIAYAPRPGLVMPPSKEVLPPPQEEIASTGNPAWPESPEQRLARIRAEATANQNDPNYKADVVRDVATTSSTPKPRNRWDEIPQEQNAASTREEFNKRLASSQQGSPTVRRYLSEPPLDLRQPAESAPTGDVGEEEWRKERAAKSAARKQTPRTLSDILPW